MYIVTTSSQTDDWNRTHPTSSYQLSVILSAVPNQLEETIKRAISLSDKLSVKVLFATGSIQCTYLSDITDTD